MDHAANGSQPRADSLQIAFRDFFSDVKTPIRGHIIAHHGNRNYMEGEEMQDYSNKNGEWGRS